MGRSRKEPFPSITEREDLPQNNRPFLKDLTPSDQPASGASVPTEKAPEKPSKLVNESKVEAAPEPPKEPEEYTFEFTVEPSIGHSHKVTVRRVEDDETSEKRFDGVNSLHDANKWVAERTKELELAKAKRMQQKAEQAAVITPLVTPSATIDMLPAQFSIEAKVPSDLAPEVLSVAERPLESNKVSNGFGFARLVNLLNWTGRPAEPNYPGELVYYSRADKSTLHVLPEFAELVKEFLGDEQVEAFRPSEEGLVITTYPSSRKARFWFAGGRAVISRI